MRKRECRREKRSYECDRTQLDEPPRLRVVRGTPSKPNQNARCRKNGELHGGCHWIGDRQPLGHARDGDTDILDLLVLTAEEKRQRPVEKVPCRRSREYNET